MAIRGENRTVFEILKDNSSYIYHDPWNSFSGNNNDPVVNVKNLLDAVIDGYAFAYHLIFLEEQKRALFLYDLKPKQDTVEKILVKLKWLGQKNQLYDVLRQLKAAGILANSYEDLAVFIKQNVDIFSETSLSTILTEIGKDKRPPKSRRINIEL